MLAIPAAATANRRHSGPNNEGIDLMAQPARITGQVLTTERRSGTSKRTDQAYDFTEVSVLVGMRGVATYTLPTDARERPGPGELVDVLVDVDVYGGRLSARYVGDWDPVMDAPLGDAAAA